MNQGADGGFWCEGGRGVGGRGQAQGCCQHTKFVKLSSDQSGEEAGHFKNAGKKECVRVRKSLSCKLQSKNRLFITVYSVTANGKQLVQLTSIEFSLQGNNH